MKNLVVTEVSLPIKLQRFGILHYLDAQDAQFYIPDWCYAEQYQTGDLSRSDIDTAKELVGEGRLNVVSLSEKQLAQVIQLKNNACSMFLARTVSALVYARSMGYTLVSENQPLRIISFQQFGVSIAHYESVAVGLQQDIISRGIDLKIELFSELV